ncbi:hypothetical protein ACP70R_016101 [Stipagrostis hirtigluma subsp. patula]
MAAAAGRSKHQLHSLHYVQLYGRLLLVAALVIGDVVAAGRPSSPATTTLQAGLAAAAAAWEERPAAGGRRTLVGSRAPTCTYNECRGCRHRCSVQEVPIDASDPINSAYRYKCVCHI